MFRSPPGSPAPRIPAPQELLSGFGRRFAMVAAPAPDWRLLVGTCAQDDFVTELDVTYVLGGRSVAMVSTSRPVPEHFRVRSETTLWGTLASFVANAGARDGSRGSELFRELETTSTPLLVDGSEVEGSGLVYGDFFGVLADLGDERIIVCGRSDAREAACAVVFGTELRGELWSRTPPAT
ncbi:hypothetical protein GCM10009760_14320 [Kitasatospora kazusensis]|uniref:Uncharacterized protein n=1 Tax=Kitasatospora kazusensis TaxID=407974 RepID=A0ABN2Z236_9ACTN